MLHRHYGVSVTVGRHGLVADSADAFAAALHRMGRRLRVKRRRRDTDADYAAKLVRVAERPVSAAQDALTSRLAILADCKELLELAQCAARKQNQPSE